MSISDQALTFSSGSNELLGIVTLPAQANSSGVLILVGGPQYRVGSHRQFLLLARGLAHAGYPVMRFDFSGMGDSSGEQPHFENVGLDIKAAIDALMATCPDLKKIVLWGLCDAASASLLYWDETRDSRLSGMVLLNPWVRSESTLARTRIKHYYGQRLFSAKFWIKMLTGKVGVTKALYGFCRNLVGARTVGKKTVSEADEPFQYKMFRAIDGFDGPILLVLSGNDYTAREFDEALASRPEWGAMVLQRKVTQTRLADADHTFSSAKFRDDVAQIASAWLKMVT